MQETARRHCVIISMLDRLRYWENAAVYIIIHKFIPCSGILPAYA